MKRMAIIFIGVGFVLIGCFVMFKDAFETSIQDTAEAVATKHVSSKINESLEKGFYDNKLDEPLLYIERDEEGSIQYLEPNSRLINKLLLSFSTNVKENYSFDDVEEIRVNLGVLTGSRVLSQLPITVKIKVHPVSLTKFEYATEFETEGINQTRYYVYCNLTSQIHIVAPFTDKTATISRKILLAEAIIVGKVPENYVMVPEDSILDAIE